MPEPIIFAIGGTVQAKAGTYLHRPADEELFEACQSGEFAYVLACRQIGKSSLMLETDRRLRQTGVRTAVIDLSGIGQRDITAESWYFSLILELADNLQLEVNVQHWWETRPSLSTPTQRFLQFLRDVMLQEISDEAIVIFIDEIDTTLELDFTDDFFVAIRSVYNDRARYPVYRRLTFALLGMATPSELIQDNSRTPFNIGRAIALRDFTREECELFQQALAAKYAQADYFEQVYGWTNGHPYLTQKLSKAALDWAETNEPDLVDTLATRLFLAPEGPIDDNLQFVQKNVTNDRQAYEMLKLYQQVLQPQEIVADDEKSVIINRLKLYGLVEARNGELQVRNKLYAQAFDQAWVEEMLEKNTHQRLGIPLRYHIVQEIARGGFSTIYLAEIKQDSGQIKNIALKVLDPREENATDMAKLIKRFERESKIVSLLEHPNIIEIYETGRSETGRGGEPALFISMKYIPGGTLARKVRDEGALRRNEAIDLIEQVGSALTYAHKQGVIHRDVKPTNILLDHDYEPIRPILTDFGLVKELATSDESFTTKPAGTFRYMAPEQLAPDRWKKFGSSPATDIYALAITFFEIVAGQHPFEADSDHKLSDPEFISRHLSDPFPRLGEVAPHVGSLFDEILDKATAKDPTQRFASVPEFIEALATANDAANRDRAARLVRAARDFDQDQNPAEAMDMIEKALHVHPQDAEALRLRGKIKSDRGLLREALADYRRAYEQESDPASAAGYDYLAILQRVAEDAWHEGAEREAFEYYGLITRILNEGRARGVDIRVWAEAWTALVAGHYAVGVETYQKGQPDNLAEVTEILARQIRALEGLEADKESHDLREKCRSLRIEAHHTAGEQAYAAGKPKSVVAAIYTLKREIQSLAKLGADKESHDLREKQRRLRVEYHHAAGEQAYSAGQPEDTAATIKTLRRKIRALERLEAEPEGQDLREKLKQCHWRLGEQAYSGGQPDNLDEAMAILAREIGALKALKAGAERQDLVEKHAWLRLKSHYQRGLAAYAGGNPDQLEQAMATLEREIATLETLRAKAEIKDLSGKLKTLQIKQQQNMIAAAVADISRLKTQTPVDNDTIFHHYEEIDKAYAALLEIEPNHEQRHHQRRQQLKERAAYRQELGSRAEQDQNYEVAMQHYQAILNIEEIKQYDSLAQELNLDLLKKVGELKEKVQHDRKYRVIEKLRDQDHLKALDRLIEDFISKGIYEHREVAKWLWQLVYAKKHEGELPPELQSATELEATQQELAKTQQQLAETGQLKEQAQAETVAAREALAEREGELEKTQTKVVTIQDKVTETEKSLAEAQAETTTLKRQLAEAKQAPQKLRRQHEINKIAIPISLIVAVAAGSILGSQIQEISGLWTIAIVAWILVFAYFIYYVWAYYLSPPYRE